MTQIIEYISQNYILFLIALVLVLLAVIGYYADKTNFGQGKSKDKELKENTEEQKIEKDVLQNEKEQQVLENPKITNQEKSSDKNVENSSHEQITLENTEITNQKKTSDKNIEDLKQEQSNEQIEEKGILENKEKTVILMNDEVTNSVLDSDGLETKQNTVELKAGREVQEDLFDKEIDSLLPQKELIDDDLLNEIESMEFNFKKEKTSFDIPNFNNISLPKIKNLVEKEQDVWKL